MACHIDDISLPRRESNYDSSLYNCVTPKIISYDCVDNVSYPTSMPIILGMRKTKEKQFCFMLLFEEKENQNRKTLKTDIIKENKPPCTCESLQLFAPLNLCLIILRGFSDYILVLDSN